MKNIKQGQVHPLWVSIEVLYLKPGNLNINLDAAQHGHESVLNAVFWVGAYSNLEHYKGSI